MDVNRIFSFYFNQVLDYNSGKDIRLCNQKKIVNMEVENFTKSSEKIFNDIGNMKAGYEGLEAGISSFLSGAVYIFVGLKAITGAITVGSIVQYAGSIKQFMSGINEILEPINIIVNNNQYLQLYIDFINLDSKRHKGTLPVEKRMMMNMK
jgi:ATP-binding cassette subfamily B protein